MSNEFDINDDGDGEEKTLPNICDCGECEECIKLKGECDCGDCDVCLAEEDEFLDEEEESF